MLLFVIGDRCTPDDRAYFEAIYKQYERMMFRVARDFTQDLCEIEDLIQTANVRLIPKVGKLRSLEEPARCAYIAETVRNAARNYLRRKELESGLFRYEDEESWETVIPDRELLPEDLVIRMDEWRRCWREIEKLSEGDQILLWGKDVLELPDKEVAELLHCKPSSVRMKLHRARKRAGKVLREGGIYYHG